MWRTAVIAAALGGFLAVSGSPACAGLIAGDSNGMPGWQGTVLYTASAALYLDVDYCVYAPGEFGLSFGSSADPSGGARYVYAYQILNNLPNPPEPQQDYVTSFSIGLTGLNEQAANVGAVAVAGGQNPNHSAFAPTSPPYNTVKWTYTTPLAYGSVSNILIYTSPFGPEFDSAEVLGYSTDTHLLPSPTPEPATMALLAAGAAAVFWRTGRRRTGSLGS